jgi:transposase-like protein
VRQLKRELERVRQERDILKKAGAIFSRSQPLGFHSSKTIGSSIW